MFALSTLYCLFNVRCLHPRALQCSSPKLRLCKSLLTSITKTSFHSLKEHKILLQLAYSPETLLQHLLRKTTFFRNHPSECSDRHLLCATKQHDMTTALQNNISHPSMHCKSVCSGKPIFAWTVHASYSFSRCQQHIVMSLCITLWLSAISPSIQTRCTLSRRVSLPPSSSGTWLLAGRRQQAWETYQGKRPPGT